MGHHHHHHIVLEDHEKEPVKIATIIGIISVILNLLLGITKIVIGRIASSSAVFSDGVHGTGDVLTTVIAVISVWIAAKKKNKKYNYGYERYASIACLVLAVILFLTAGEIIVESTESLIAGISGDSHCILRALVGFLLCRFSQYLSESSHVFHHDVWCEKSRFQRHESRCLASGD